MSSTSKKRLADHKYGEDRSLDLIESSPPYTSTPCTVPICRQFWRAGDYDSSQYCKAPAQSGRSRLGIHPNFLHSNATSHKWTFGAIAELLDNAVDEIQNGATFVIVDKTVNPRDGSPALLLQDDGGGMDPEAIRGCMSFGFSNKKIKSTIGQYGNGFKTSSMRLGADTIVFTRQLKNGRITQSIGLLSYTFLRQNNYDEVVVPLVDYEFSPSKQQFEPILCRGKEHFSSNLTVLLRWSPYSTEQMLIKQFDDLGQHGTKIVIFNLWCNDGGDLELDFDSDAEDIRLNADAKLFQQEQQSRAVSEQHIANLYHYSLRVYASILYLRLPQNFRIILRGRPVEHHSIANDLKFPEFLLYKPRVGHNVEVEVVTTIGFLKEAPRVNIHGFNIYHRNRLILPFWRVVKESTNSVGRGVVGILEANYVQPTHSKQDFEKTSLFQKLEARLKQMTLEYWKLYCGWIGYQQVRRPSAASMPTPNPLSVQAKNCVVQPVILNSSSSAFDKSGPVSSAVGPSQDFPRRPSPASVPTPNPLSVQAKNCVVQPVFLNASSSAFDKSGRDSSAVGPSIKFPCRPSPASLPTTNPLSVQAKNCVVQPVFLNPSSSAFDKLGVFSSAVGPSEDFPDTQPHVSRKNLEQFPANHHEISTTGSKGKRQGQNPALGYQYHNRQPTTAHNVSQLPEEETASVLQENEKLRLQSLELESRQEVLKQKVQVLKDQLDNARSEHAKLLAELETTSTIKDEPVEE